MGVNLNHWGQGLILTVLIASSPGAVFAEEVDEAVGHLEAPSIPEVVDRNVNLETFWEYATTLGDTKFFFNIDRQEQGLTNSGFRIEALYKDLLKQQDDNNPTVRTQDITNPYSTSVFELQRLERSNEFGAGTPVP